MIQFEETIKTEATRELYRYTLNKFLAWSQIRDFDSILKLTDEKLSEKLIGYIIHLKELVSNGDISPNTVPKYFNGIEHFLVMNDRIFNWTKLHKMYTAKKKEASDRMGISLNPHLLRTVFTEKCGQAGIKDKYIETPFVAARQSGYSQGTTSTIPLRPCGGSMTWQSRTLPAGRYHDNFISEITTIIIARISLSPLISVA